MGKRLSEFESFEEWHLSSPLPRSLSGAAKDLEYCLVPGWKQLGYSLEDTVLTHPRVMWVYYNPDPPRTLLWKRLDIPQCFQLKPGIKIEQAEDQAGDSFKEYALQLGALGRFQSRYQILPFTNFSPRAGLVVDQLYARSAVERDPDRPGVSGSRPGKIHQDPHRLIIVAQLTSSTGVLNMALNDLRINGAPEDHPKVQAVKLALERVKDLPLTLRD